MMPALVTRLGLMPALVLGLVSGNAISATPLKETVQGFIPPEGRALGSEIHGPIQGSIPSEEVAMGSWFTLNVHDLWEKSPTNKVCTQYAFPLSACGFTINVAEDPCPCEERPGDPASPSVRSNSTGPLSAGKVKNGPWCVAYADETDGRSVSVVALHASLTPVVSQNALTAIGTSAFYHLVLSALVTTALLITALLVAEGGGTHGGASLAYTNPAESKNPSVKSMSMSMTRYILFLILITIPAATGVCEVCYEEGHETANCPLVTGVAVNVATVAAVGGGKKVIEIAKLLPTYLCRLFNRGVLQTLVTLAQRATASTGFELKDDTKPSAIIAAVTQGILTKADAITHLSGWLDADGEGAEAKHAQATRTMEMLKMMDAVEPMSAVGSVQGPFRFVYAKISYYVSSGAGMAAFQIDNVIEATKDPSSSAVHTAKLYVPKTQEEFFEALNLWIMVCHAVGLANVLVLTRFIQDVVYSNIRSKGFTWRLAFELFLVYLGELEEKGVHNMSNIVDHSAYDGKVRQAEAQGKEHYGSLFMSRGQSSRVPGDVPNSDKKTFNGKFNKTSDLTCHTFNNADGRDHPASALNADGSCKFKHACDHKVKLADGKTGKCLGAHPRSQCDNPNRI